MKVLDLKALAKECGLRGYSKLKKAELIIFLQNNLRPTPALRPIPAPRPPTWEPIDDRPRPMPSVRPQLPDLQNPTPYQLRPKRGKETFIEPPVEQKELPPTNPKQIKV